MLSCSYVAFRSAKVSGLVAFRSMNFRGWCRLSLYESFALVAFRSAKVSGLSPFAPRKFRAVAFRSTKVRRFRGAKGDKGASCHTADIRG